MKEIIRVILRTATFVTTFVLLIGAMGYLFEYMGTEETLGKTIFWSVACFLTALKISLIKEGF